MTPATGFPRELLARPAADRLAYFRGYTMAHPLLQAADEALLRAVREPAGATLIFVVGPTGVGKTTLQRRLVRRLTEAALPALAEDPGRLPVVGLEAVPPDGRSFSWKDYYLRALAALDEPLIAHKRACVAARRGEGEALLAATTRWAVAPALRRALEQALLHRRPAAFVVDEAQHLAKLSSGRKLQDQLDCLKSLASLTGTVHVLVGTYELLAFRNLSGQLGRRSLDIHFPRYRQERAEDAHAFLRVLRTFQHHLPLPGESDLGGQWELCYERSLGCVGMLKDWLTRALAAALEQDAAALQPAHLAAHAPAVAQCLRMATEAREGEARLAESAAERAHLQALLGLAPAGASGGAAATPPPPAARSAGRVGRRAPQRDAVGVEEVARAD